MSALAIDWTEGAAQSLSCLESSLNQLALRQRAIMLIAESKLSGGRRPAVFNEEAAESLYSLLCDQGEAISQLIDSYYTAHNGSHPEAPP